MNPIIIDVVVAAVSVVGGAIAGFTTGLAGGRWSKKKLPPADSRELTAEEMEMKRQVEAVTAERFPELSRR